MPQNIFAGSADRLETIKTFDAKVLRITPDMFKRMRKLKRLDMRFTELMTIDDGALDDLVELEVLEINYSDFSTSPDGLFKNMKKLKRVKTETSTS